MNEPTNESILRSELAKARVDVLIANECRDRAQRNEEALTLEAKNLRFELDAAHREIAGLR